jgi:hypothetical protein
VKQEVTKQRQQELINDKIRQREQLYNSQAAQLAQVKNNEAERLSRQVQQLEKKQAEAEKKQADDKHLLKQQYEQSLQEQLQRRQREKQQQLEEKQQFRETWNQKLSALSDAQADQQLFTKNVHLRNQQELRRQIDQKATKRELQFEQELAEAEQAKAAIENKDTQFKSYAEKCLKEWESNGKNLYPIIKQLATTMKST